MECDIDLVDILRIPRELITSHEFETKCFHGEGSVRDLCAGEYFTLEGHPEIDRHPPQEREFVVTAMRIAARN
ncbi:contractile injection system protein, VgrG/Pvc8 family, partial [Oxalobacteraceae bacterium A2-2]